MLYAWLPRFRQRHIEQEIASPPFGREESWNTFSQEAISGAIHFLFLVVSSFTDRMCCIISGDQADQKLLDKILADSKAFGGYDVIIDDGGHTVNQMLTSIKVRSPLNCDFSESRLHHQLAIFCKQHSNARCIYIGSCTLHSQFKACMLHSSTLAHLLQGGKFD